MVSVAVIVTTYSLFFGNRTLDVDMHKQQVLRIVQQELEYWVGRMYIGQPGVDPSVMEMTGSGGSPYKVIELDPDSKSPIDVRLYYDPITPVADFNSESGVAYWIVTVWAEWDEPDGESFARANDKAVILTTYVSKMGN